MVQRKVSKTLRVEAKNAFKTEKMHVTEHPSVQNYDEKSKVADLKTTRMKKSRLNKHSDVEFALREMKQTSGEPPTVVTTKTPSLKKTALYESPNYMKSTNSSEARTSVSTTLKLHKVERSSVSFKHTRKMVLCKNVEAERATCSSTLKDSKFPPYLTLTPGATEAEGTSVMKVCPYKYCSLNGHHHRPALPLKAFLSSKRRMLKTLKNVKPQGFSPAKRKRSEIQVAQEDDFFVEIHVPETDFQDDGSLSEGNFFGSEEKADAKCPSTPSECYSTGIDMEMDSDSSVSRDQHFGENSDMEWEEGQIMEFQAEKVEVPVGKDYGDDETEPGFELLEKFLAEKLLPYAPIIHDEIMELLQFSDADTLSDTDLSLTEDGYIDNQVVDDKPICTAELGEESIEEQDTGFSNPFAEVTKASNQDLDSFETPKEIDEDELDEGLYTVEETEESVLKKERIENEEKVCAGEHIPIADNDMNCVTNTEDANLSISAENGVNCVTNTELKETEVKGSSSTTYDQGHDSNEVNLQSFENNVAELKELKSEEINQTEDEVALPDMRKNSQQVQKGISSRGNNSIDELVESCNKLKRSVKCRKMEKECEEGREFNPRGPNFLPVEPEPEPEKVDLRHQDMDERRNAEDWMLDHALQRSVNQLATARKKKVALLVEAFESVLPMPKYEPPHVRRTSSCIPQARPIQACR